MAHAPIPRLEDRRGGLEYDLAEHSRKRSQHPRYGQPDENRHGLFGPTEPALRKELATSMSQGIGRDQPTLPIDMPSSNDYSNGRHSYERESYHHHRSRTSDPMDTERSSRVQHKQLDTHFTPPVLVDDAGSRPMDCKEKSTVPKLSVRTRPRGRSLLDEIAKKRNGSSDGQRKERSAVRNISSLQQTVPEGQTIMTSLPSSNKGISPPEGEHSMSRERMVEDMYSSPTTYTPMSGSPTSAASSWLGRYSASRPPSTRRRSQRSNTGSLQNSPAAAFLRQYSTSSTGPAPLAPDAEGQEVGNYILGKEIGSGGFSTVREASHPSDPSTNPILAVKIVRKRIKGLSEAENEEVQKLLDHELEIWRSIHHEGVLQLRDVFSTEFATFAFMPLAVQGSLFDAVKAVKTVGLEPGLVRDYAAQIAEALRYLHRDVKIVHQDVKLENCLLLAKHGTYTQESEYFNPQQRVVLADFGLAEYMYDDEAKALGPRDEHGGPHLSRPTSPREDQKEGPRGSLHYAAPETLHPPKGQQPPLSPRVDIWAFGVMLFAMITGRRPFVNSFEPKLIESIKAGDWDRDLLKERVQRTRNDCGVPETKIPDEAVVESLAVEHPEERTRYENAAKSEHGSSLSHSSAPTKIMANEAWARSCSTIIVSDGVDPQAITEVVKGCLNTNPKERWDIGQVVESEWLVSEMGPE